MAPRAWLAILVIAAMTAGCGKKGPPLAPMVRVPSAAPFSGPPRRIGQDVYLTVGVPKTNVDDSIPADVDRIDIFAYTGYSAPPSNRFFEVGALVATIKVAPPPVVSDERTPRTLVPESPALGALRGTAVTVRESLSPEDFIPVPLPTLQTRGRQPAPPLVPAAAPVGNPRRFYLAIPFSRRNVPGERAPMVDIELGLVPEAPPDLRASYSVDGVALAWGPAGGLLGFLLDRQLPEEVPPFDVAAPVPGAATVSALPPGPTRYNVYRDSSFDPLVLPPPVAASRWSVPLPAPINPAPLETLTFDDPVAVDEREHCYTVRAVRGADPAVVISAPSPPQCIVTVDVFPPVAPTNLDAVATVGAVNLIWEPNGEADIGGYVVLRAAGSDDTLAPLPGMPIADTRYTDRAVVPGMRYRYVVKAVDNRLPLPNESEPSAPVEIVAQ